MIDEDKTKEQRTGEMVQLNRQIVELKTAKTNRKQVREALLDSEQQFRALIENAQDAIVIVNPDVTIRYESPSMERMTGREAKDRIGKNPFDFCHPDDITKVAEAFIQLLENKIAIAHTELRLQHKNGRWLTFEVIGTNLIDNPVVGGIVLNLRDITERKQAEEKLIRLSNAVRMSNDSIVISDLEAKIVEVNEATLRMYGTDDKWDLVGKNSFDLFAPEDREKAIAGTKEVLERGYVENQEYHIITKDGGTVLVAMDTAIMKDVDGKPTGFVAVSRDITERKRMEQAIQESQEKLRIIFDTIGEGITVVDLAGNIVDVNETVLRMKGFSREDVIGRYGLDFVAEKDRARATDAMMDFLKGREETTPMREVTLLTKDGGEIPCEANCTLLRDSSGNLAGFITVERDITERKRAEQQIRESEELLRAFMESATDVYTIFNSKLELLDVSEKGTKAFLPNATREDMIGKHITEIVPDIKKTGRYQDYLNVIKTGKPFQVDDTIFHAKFAVRHVSLKAFKVGDGMGLVITDITERKKAEKALRESEEFSSSLLDNAPNPVLVINPDTSLRYVNPALEKLTGFSNTELVNRKTPYPWWTEEKYEKTIKDFEEAMSKGAEGLEELFQRKNGERFWVEINSRPIRRNGELDHYLANWVDITERKKGEEELRHYSERLRVMAMQLSAAEDNERRRLAQELHDRVGQNLTALSINLSMVRTQLPEEAVAPVSSTLDDSQSIVEQTAAIIRDVMSNLQPPVLEEYGLVAALRWYADRFASRTGISVTVQGEDPSPRLSTSSENSLFRIVQETLTNVAKHAQATQVTVTLVAETKTVRLVVTDDGIGFNTEDVINPDVQKGWGLTTMSERAKNLGGSFDIESRPGHGTRVVVEIGR